MDISAARSAFLKTMGSYEAFWCVAGGWAIDLFLGRQTREHEDFEVIALRREYEILFGHLRSHNPQKIISGEPPQFVKWTGGPIEDDIIQLRLDPLQEVEFDVLLTPSEGDEWICRRDETIRLPLNEVYRTTLEGVKYLAPEIVLLFKAKYVRDKDESDFQNAFPALSQEQKMWLHAALTKVHPGHEWLNAFQANSPVDP